MFVFHAMRFPSSTKIDQSEEVITSDYNVAHVEPQSFSFQIFGRSPEGTQCSVSTLNRKNENEKKVGENSKGNSSTSPPPRFSESSPPAEISLKWPMRADLNEFALAIQVEARHKTRNEPFSPTSKENFRVKNETRTDRLLVLR